jgi:CheY-like chemotaxis protein
MRRAKAAAARSPLANGSTNGSRPDRAPSRPHARILVIEDHRDTRELLELLLRTEGYEVTLAADGDEGTTAYRRQPAEVVLVDIFMPRKDGISTITELRRDFPDAVIIAMSADASLDRRSALMRARDAGAHLTLRKPIEPWVLLRSLEGLLAGRRSLAVANG